MGDRSRCSTIRPANRRTSSPDWVVLAVPQRPVDWLYHDLVERRRERRARRRLHRAPPGARRGGRGRTRRLIRVTESGRGIGVTSVTQDGCLAVAIRGLFRGCMNGPDDETRATLLDAARTLLEADGPAALTVRRIAAEAGMSTMNVYSRFGGKDGVVDELYCEGFLASASTSPNTPSPTIRSRTSALPASPTATSRSRTARSTTSCSSVRFRATSRRPSARRVALDGFDELVARIRELMDAGEIARLRSVQRGGLALGDVSRARRARDQPRRPGRHRLGDDVPRFAGRAAALELVLNPPRQSVTVDR